MSLIKNQIIPLEIISISNDANGVGKYEGQTVFVPFTSVGDELMVKVVKPTPTYAFAIIESITKKGDTRIEQDCPIYKKCGGCSLRHITYEAELKAKKDFVKDAMQRIGGVSAPVDDTIPSPNVDRYRNKVQLPFCTNEKGDIFTGFFAERSHRIVPCEDCLLQPQIFTNIAREVCQIAKRHNMTVYDEVQQKGLLRHLFLRISQNKKVMICFVINGRHLPFDKAIAAELVQKFSEIETICVNVNKENTNVILGDKTTILFGNGMLSDTLCRVPVELSPNSFLQINAPCAERLYAKAQELADIKKGETILDLYCGAGTIGLSMAKNCKKLIGVEIVPKAIESAKISAEKMNIKNAEFICADAGKAATMLAESGLSPNVVIADPPRKGCDEQALKAIIKMTPDRIIMISCNPSTAARDIKYLEQNNYQTKSIHPADMFPRTGHVECVVKLCRVEK